MSNMPMVRLSNMTQAQYPGYRDWFIEEYARDLSTNHGYAMAQGRINAAASIEGYLPQGVASAGHSLYCIDTDHDQQTQQVVGYLWIGYKADSAFIYDFCILPPWQRRGYGSAALFLLDKVMRDRGVSELGLRVAADNPQAKALYDKCGFLVTGVNMAKSLL
ncbi:GNAT family N-acetyltransferase [Acerihabitans sp. TG2]|uniref:GNAT family N-acetyltransferase n=1 Tax=Acerihabitans sp. TG2 TaxID=3096008 RepID=UPI002B2352BD|nr:GNAT family N-acetyltransferase [Acerihabitans sp. TG2]MEA9389604.1 GNAT family N-acetyltransferase [Acerihabitans sp. TG2]